MEKYLTAIEFRYSSAPRYEDDLTSLSKTITIGVYDTFEEACKNGNELMEVLESKFQIHTFPDGREAKRERFTKNGGCFGGKNTLITNLAYLRTPFGFYAKITTLKIDDVVTTINNVVAAAKSYQEYKKNRDVST